MPLPRSASLATQSRKLSLKLKYQRTHRTTISWLTCRPLNSSSIGTNRGIWPSSANSWSVCTRALWTQQDYSESDLLLAERAAARYLHGSPRTDADHGPPVMRHEQSRSGRTRRSEERRV